MTEFTKKMCPIYRDIGTNNNPNYARIDKSTLWEVEFNATTENKEYITDDTPTTKIKNYKPTMSQELETTSDDTTGIYDVMMDRAMRLPTGDEAKATYLIVLPYKHQDGNYYTWKIEVTEEFDSLSMVDKKVTWDILVGGNIDVGIITIKDGVISFVSESELDDETLTDEEEIDEPNEDSEDIA